MARIAGMRIIKSKSGKTTHVVLSMKQHGKMPEDMIDHAEMEAARKDVNLPWEEVKQKLNKKWGFDGEKVQRKHQR